MYCDPRYENRLRFTIAHEVGHLVLHRDIFLDLAINSPEDLYRASRGMSEEDYKWLELQAYMFAGHVLVPSDLLLSEVNSRLKLSGKKLTPEELYPISQDLLDLFQVSGEVLVRRLGKEGIIDQDGV